MKNILLYLLFLTISLGSCRDKSTPDGEYTTNIREAQKWVVGTWKLTNAVYQIPNTTIPNVNMTISGNKIRLLQDGKQIDNVDFEVIQTDHTLQLKTNAQRRQDNAYLHNLDIKISNNKMLLYIYNIADGPEYTFERVK